MNVSKKSGNLAKPSGPDSSKDSQDSKPFRESKTFFRKPGDEVRTKTGTRKIKVIVKSYDTKILDETVKKMSDTLRKLGLMFSGPIPLPVDKTFITVLKSPHVHKDARQVFEMKEKKRILEIVESKKAIEALSDMKHSNPSINITVKFELRGSA